MKNNNCKFLRDLCKVLTSLGVNDTALGLTCEDYQKIRKRFDKKQELDKLIIDRESNYFTVEMPNHKYLHIKQIKN